MISCILLSAGLSQRFGTPKALATINGSSILERQQRFLIDSFVDEICVVLGASVDLLKPYILNHTKVKVVYNKDYIFGQTSSFKVGLQNISSRATGVLLLPIDCPCIETETINYICKLNKDKYPNKILIPTFKGIKGHPPLFPDKFFDQLKMLSNDQGVNAVIKTNHDNVEKVEINDPGIIRSFNTSEEFDGLKKEFGFI